MSLSSSSRSIQFEKGVKTSLFMSEALSFVTAPGELLRSRHSQEQSEPGGVDEQRTVKPFGILIAEKRQPPSGSVAAPPFFLCVQIKPRTPSSES